MFSTLQTIKFLFSTSDKKGNSIEMNKDILTKLKFISTFEVGQKIDCTNLRVESNTIITPIKRFFMGDSRDQTIKFLNNTIDRSFEILQVYLNSEKRSEQIICNNIINDLRGSIKGLDNLKETYKEDKIFVCSIDIIIESINAKLLELAEMGKNEKYEPRETLLERDFKEDHKKNKK
jgi:hypothetical protein